MDAAYQYDMTIKLFGAQAEPVFESEEQLSTLWGRPWGCDNDVGQIRVVLMHRPGPELEVVDPSKHIEALGTYGDPEVGWYWQSATIPPLSALQEQHDALAEALRAEGAEVVMLEGVEAPRLKSCYTRDPLIAVKGGAVVCRMGPRIRRGEELAVTRTLAKLGVPILRTVHGSGLMEGGSFAWINPETAVVGRSIRVNEAASKQLEEVLAVQGAELIRVDMCGYNMHIDGAFVMIDKDVALIDPAALPHWFIVKLKELGVKAVELHPDDNGWIVNCLAVSPGRVIMPEGASATTLKALDALNIERVTIPYDKVALNGGGIHCSTCPLIRDPVD
ncbi:MAG: arginine deiminase family protein [Pseudomonadota bacterium]